MRGIAATACHAVPRVGAGPRGPGLVRATWVAVVMAAGVAGHPGVAGAALPLAGSVLASPAAGATATAEGDGGASATTTEPGVNASVQPVTPTLYLKPVGLTGGGTLPAYWKVWWDPATRSKYVVALQQHVDGAHARAEAQTLDAANRTPGSQVDNPAGWAFASQFAVPSVPGAVGYVWTATIDGTPDEFRFAVFPEGDLVELVSETTYGAPTSPGEVDALALDQFDYSSSHGDGGVPGWLWVLLAVVALGGLAAFTAARSRRSARAAVTGPPGWSNGPYAPAPGAYGHQGYGTAPPGPWSPPAWTPPVWTPPRPPGAPPSPPAVGPPDRALEPASPLPTFGAFMAGADPGSESPGPLPSPPPRAAPPVLPPAGWFPDPRPDPAGPSRQRYWDGSAWTDHYHPA